MIDGEVGVQQCVLFSGQSGAGAEVVREARPSRHDVDRRIVILRLCSAIQTSFPVVTSFSQEVHKKQLSIVTNW
jgi:hypothetical protein